MGWIKIPRFVTTNLPSVSQRGEFISTLAAGPVLRVRCSACLQEQTGFRSGLGPNLPVRLSVSWVLAEVVRFLGQRQDLFFMAQQSSMSFVLALVPQSHRSDTRGPGRCHASSGAVSQTAHTELFIASGKQACTWTTADTTREVGQGESTQEPHS